MVGWVLILGGSASAWTWIDRSILKFEYGYRVLCSREIEKRSLKRWTDHGPAHVKVSGCPWPRPSLLNYTLLSPRRWYILCIPYMVSNLLNHLRWRSTTKSGGLMVQYSLPCGLVRSRLYVRILFWAMLLEEALELVPWRTPTPWTVLGLQWCYVYGTSVSTGYPVRWGHYYLCQKVRTLRNESGWVTTTYALLFIDPN